MNKILVVVSRSVDCLSLKSDRSIDILPNFSPEPGPPDSK